MLKTPQLAVQLAPQHPITVAEGAHGDSSHPVEVTASCLIPEPHTLSPHQFQGETGVGVHDRGRR